MREECLDRNRFPDTLVVTETYYGPESKTFPAFDSFGVDSGSKTLCFFF